VLETLSAAPSPWINKPLGNAGASDRRGQPVRQTTRYEQQVGS